MLWESQSPALCFQPFWGLHAGAPRVASIWVGVGSSFLQKHSEILRLSVSFQQELGVLKLSCPPCQLHESAL